MRWEMGVYMIHNYRKQIMYSAVPIEV